MQGLFNSGQIFHGLEQLFVPYFVVANQIVGVHNFAPRSFFFAPERFMNIQLAVVIGQFFAGLYVSYGDFVIIRGGKAVGMKAVIYISGVVPAQNIVALAVAETVLAENFLVHWG